MEADRIIAAPSPTSTAYYSSLPVAITWDSGATSSLILLSSAQRRGLDIGPTHHSANQADGITKLTVLDEVHCVLSRGHCQLNNEAAVVESLDCDILVSIQFLNQNSITTDFSKR